MKESKQKLEKSEFQALIEKSDRQELGSTIIEFAKVFLLPLTLALISIGATWSINTQQEKNAKTLADKQIESAEIIAKANRDNSAAISASDQRIEQIKHIKNIFQEIITEKCEKPGTIIMQIRSLEVYKQDALSFLLNIKDHFSNHDGMGDVAHNPQRKKQLQQFVHQTEESISNILQNSQIDLSGRIFVNAGQHDQEKVGNKARKMANWVAREMNQDKCGDYEKLMSATTLFQMRKQKYHNYNFSDCIFINTNLYQADFSSCTLDRAIFMDVDLQEADFFESNLSNAIFINCNLKRVDFIKSGVKNTLFFHPISKLRTAGASVESKNGLFCELEDAKFALGTLMKINSLPFNLLVSGKEEHYQLYVNLLTPYRKKIQKMNHLKDKNLKNLLEAIGKEFSQLDLDLKKEEERLKQHSTGTTKKDVPLVFTVHGDKNYLRTA
ncbi:MAG: pentapeptide repeat-containing protein [Desulfobacteraceae bacterium]|nr:pentapeptide repeat-containing protein [Desulfobacteraceae bacterium]